MRIFKIILDSKKDKPQELYLGVAGENNVTQIQFDISSWVDAFGIGEVNLLNQRSVDASPYPVTINFENNIVTWTVSNIDSARSGIGNCMLIYTIDSKVKKSAVFKTLISNSLGQENDIPEPYTSWFDEILVKLEEIKALIPVPTFDDANKILCVNSSGKYELKNLN